MHRAGRKTSFVHTRAKRVPHDHVPGPPLGDRGRRLLAVVSSLDIELSLAQGVRLGYRPWARSLVVTRLTVVLLVVAEGVRK